MPEMVINRCRLTIFGFVTPQNPINRLPHPRPPPAYGPARFELLARYLEALVAAGRKPRLEEFWNPIRMPNGKTDINNNGGFSTDFIGANYEYP